MVASSTKSVDKLEVEGPLDPKPIIGINDVDTAAQLTAGKHISFTPEEVVRIRFVTNAITRLCDSLTIVHMTDVKSTGI